MNQEQSVLNHLLYKGNLTRLDALNLYGTIELPAIVFNLRKQGHCIETRKRRSAKGKHFAEYEYVGKQVREGYAPKKPSNCEGDMFGCKPQDYARPSWL